MVALLHLFVKAYLICRSLPNKANNSDQNEDVIYIMFEVQAYSLKIEPLQSNILIKVLIKSQEQQIMETPE